MSSVDSGDTALPKGPRFNLVKLLAVRYRRPPCPTARERVDLGGFLPVGRGVVSPSYRGALQVHCRALL